jgi:hypothetical protein
MGDNTFACEACGKRFPWKAELAGKKARCKCGAVLHVPAGAPRAGEDLDDLYALAEPAPGAAATRGVVAARAAVAATPAAPAAHGAPVYAKKSRVGLEYDSGVGKKKDRFSEEAMTHKPRDVYVPWALLWAGFIATAAWAAVRHDLSFGQLTVFWLIVEATVAVKTGIIVGLAILIAPRLGIGLGLLRPAILKLAAIIVVSDAVMLWMDTFMPGRWSSGFVRGGGIRLVLVGVVISAMMHYLFDMERDETAMVAVPMAILSRVLGFFLNLAVIAVLAGMSGSADDGGDSGPEDRRPETPGNVGGGGGDTDGKEPSAPPAPEEPPVKETAADRTIAEHIKRSKATVKDAREAIGGMVNARGLRPLMEAAYAAGARRIHVETLALGGSGRRVYIELGGDPAVREKCYAAIRKEAEGYGMTFEDGTDVDQGRRYVVLRMAGR